MSSYEPSGKLPGKTQFSGRRRSTTRVSGFHVHPETTGGEFKTDTAESHRLGAGESVSIEFEIPAGYKGSFVGYGAWFRAPTATSCAVVRENAPPKYTLSTPAAPNWSKLGSMWVSNGAASEIVCTLTATEESDVALWKPGCGVIEHAHLDAARQALLKNMYQFSPEAHFYTVPGAVSVTVPAVGGRVREPTAAQIPLKSCNRCGRFLPINLQNEQKQLSFSNHCKAENRRPCKHGAFGRLRDVDTGDTIRLDYGFQLECRFCKKFEVNAAHNPQRSAAQMKEDAARRRFFELLLSELYGESSQLRYRHQTGRELADDVWQRFGGVCFNCGQSLETARDMHLDHTRPLAFLWPLDGTATALCGSCNSAKRDRAPADFYNADQLCKLASLTGIPEAELIDPSPNVEAVRLLRARLPWFFGDFLCRAELARERDGKTASELLVKALEKVISACPPKERFHLMNEFEERQGY
jgi:hypothetical protein